MATIDGQSSIETGNSHPAIAESRLADGQRLDQATFHEIYAEMPEDFRAELVDGVVHLMNRPLYSDHGRPNAAITGLLCIYSFGTPGTIVQNATSTKLGAENEVQPDSALLIDPAFGGRILEDEKGLTTNAPELVVEVASSTLRLDLNAKKRIYEEAGALEYVVFDVPHQKFHCFALNEGRFELLEIDLDGLFRSKVFPGLWVDESAFLRNDGQAMTASLRLGLESEEHTAFVERLRANRANRP